MEKNWAVECWGEFPGLKYKGTQIFYTKAEAESYFKHIRKQLDSSKYIMTKDVITDSEDTENVILLTDLREL